MQTPLKFKSRTCPVCGVDNSIYPIDKLGRLTRNLDIFPLSKLKCSNCRTEFFIEWDLSDKDKPYPIAVSKETHIKQFVNYASKYTKNHSRPALSYDKYDFTGT